MGADFISSKNWGNNFEKLIDEELKSELQEIKLLVSFELNDKSKSKDDIKKRIYYIIDNSACMTSDANDVCAFSKLDNTGMLAFNKYAVLSMDADAFKKALSQICSIIGLGECRLVIKSGEKFDVVTFKDEKFFNEQHIIVSQQDFVTKLKLVQ